MDEDELFNETVDMARNAMMGDPRGMTHTYLAMTTGIVAGAMIATSQLPTDEVVESRRETSTLLLELKRKVDVLIGAWENQDAESILTVLHLLSMDYTLLVAHLMLCSGMEGAALITHSEEQFERIARLVYGKED